MRGEKIWVPELAGLGGNDQGVFVVEDAGGAFPEGSPRFDVFFADPAAGWDWYRASEGPRTGALTYVQQELPPEIEDTPGS
jgi:hypothetical protein